MWKRQMLKKARQLHIRKTQYVQAFRFNVNYPVKTLRNWTKNSDEDKNFSKIVNNYPKKIT